MSTYETPYSDLDGTDQSQLEAELLEMPRGPRLNLAIGPNCPTRCEGCYNNFGDTFSVGSVVTAAEVIDFAEEVRQRDIDGVTLSGGDPLFHPEITQIIDGLYSLGYRTKIDTVGTSLLESPRIIYKGRGISQHVEIGEISGKVESITLPLDGVTQEVVASFRKGRPHLLEETKIIAGKLVEAHVDFSLNTVVNAANLHQVQEIGYLAANLGAFKWHLFEYDDSGPNPSARKADLRITTEDFENAVADLHTLPLGNMELDVRRQDSRVGEGAYFFINDAGEAWCPTGSLPIRYGHITHDREQVMSAYDRYLQAFQQKFYSDESTT